MQKRDCKPFYYHVIKSEEAQVLYFPVPKNMCSTLKQAIYFLEHKEDYDKEREQKDIHEYYFEREIKYQTKKAIKSSDYTKLAVIRDPIKRFVSAYRNRVLDLGDMLPFASQLQKQGLSVKPDLNTFVENLAVYRAVVPSIRHHTDPQTYFLGTDMTIFDVVKDIHQAAEVFALFQDKCPELTFKREKSGGTQVKQEELTPQSISALESFYAEDYQILGPYL